MAAKIALDALVITFDQDNHVREVQHKGARKDMYRPLV